MTTLLLLMGCAGIGRSGKQDSVTFDPDTASVVSIDENEIFKNGDILLEPKVEIDAPEVVFSLRDSGNLEGLIEIDPQTGVITAANNLTPDHETQSEYTFTIVASFGSQESTQTIKVVINDLNDSPPIFANISPNAVSIDRDSDGLPVSASLPVKENETFEELVGAVPDVEGDSVSYALSGADAALFQIDENAILSPLAGTNFDHETKDEY